MHKIPLKKSFIFSILSVFIVGYLLGLKIHQIKTGYAQAQEITLNKQRSLIDDLRVQLGIQETQINTMDVAITQLEQTILDLEKTIQEQENNLDFYKKILRPTTQKDAVRLDSMRIEPLSSQQLYRYRLVLTQTAKQRSMNRGRIEISLQGSQNGEIKTLSARELGMDKQDNQFAFRYYQVLEGDWQLPKDFAPDFLKIRLVSNQYPTQEHESSWDALLKTDDKS